MAHGVILAISIYFVPVLAFLWMLAIFLNYTENFPIHERTGYIDPSWRLEEEVSPVQRKQKKTTEDNK